VIPGLISLLLRADPQRQGRRPRGADIADLAGVGNRARHQGRELVADTAGGTGYAVEFGGAVIRALSMEARMTL